MIVHKREGGRDTYMIECDQCGLLVLDGNSMVVPQADGSLKFFHKNMKQNPLSCDPGDDKMPHGWMELGHVLAYLVHNTKTDMAQANRAIDLFSQMGG
jgi:hypothetical protein